MLILKYTSESELYMETTLPIYENGDKHRTSILYNTSKLSYTHYAYSNITILQY